MRVSVTGFVKGIRTLARPAASASLGALVMALALAAWVIPTSTARAANLDSPISIDFRNPQPSGGVAQGPTGANIFAQGSVPAGDGVAIGFAPQSAGCSSGFQSISAQPSMQSNGNFSVAFKWPEAANTVNAEYYLCAQDTTSNTVGQSSSLYRVVAGSDPAISIQQVDNPNAPTAIPGTPTPAPTATAPSGKLYSGGYIQIQGVNFDPGGQSVSFFLTPGAFKAPDYNPNSALTVANGDTRTASDGSFSVVVQLPEGETGSNLTLSAVSQDGTSTTLPTLVASQQVAIITSPPTPTPNPTVSPTTSVTTNNNTTTTTPKKQVTATQVVGLIGLGILSVILFIVGVAFLISASSAPNPQV